MIEKIIYLANLSYIKIKNILFYKIKNKKYALAVHSYYAFSIIIKFKNFVKLFTHEIFIYLRLCYKQKRKTYIG